MEMIRVVLRHAMYLVQLVAFDQTPVEIRHASLVSTTVIFVSIVNVHSVLTMLMAAV
jgi:hypothetical protein